MVLWYGLFTVLSGVAVFNLTALAWMRAATGAGEAASMPAATGGVSPWVPHGHRTVSQGLMHAATRLGAALTVPISVAGIAAFGIPGPFYIFGFATILIGLVWSVAYRTPRGKRLAQPAAHRARRVVGDLAQPQHVGALRCRFLLFLYAHDLPHMVADFPDQEPSFHDAEGRYLRVSAFCRRHFR